jgi:myosin heavy subunit
MFTMEQKEYKKEKVPWENIKFVDNQGCIDLIESYTSVSIFRLLDEACGMNQKDDKYAASI